MDSNNNQQTTADSSNDPDLNQSNQTINVTNVTQSRPITGEDLINIRMVSGRTIVNQSDYPGTNVVVTTDDTSATAASVRSSKPRLGQTSTTTGNETVTDDYDDDDDATTTSKSTTETTTTTATAAATTTATTDAQDTRLSQVVASSSTNTSGSKILCNTLNAKIAKTSKLKFLILGSKNVGKTLILRRMQNINWPLIMLNNDQYRPTVGPDLHRLKCGTIEAIDIGGEERFVTRAKKYCELFTVFLIVFDVNNAETFLMARYWMDFLHTNPLINVKHVVLIGNKTDLAQTRRKVSIRMARNLALTFEAGYLEISAKMDLTMDKVFETLEAKQDQSSNRI